jgi:sec-independent protein translocase protein TatA
MFGISGEHLLILGIVLLIFGPRRLPELGHTLGKCVRNFKDALAGVEEAKFQRIEEPAAQPQQAEAQTQSTNTATPSSTAAHT